MGFGVVGRVSFGRSFFKVVNFGVVGLVGLGVVGRVSFGVLIVVGHTGLEVVGQFNHVGFEVVGFGVVGLVGFGVVGRVGS